MRFSASMPLYGLAATPAYVLSVNTCVSKQVCQYINESVCRQTTEPIIPYGQSVYPFARMDLRSVPEALSTRLRAFPAEAEKHCYTAISFVSGTKKPYPYPDSYRGKDRWHGLARVWLHLALRAVIQTIGRCGIFVR